MTRDKIMAMEAGPEMDRLIAEKVMGWRRMIGPGYDYDGPRNPDEIAVPPWISDDEFKRFRFPPRGPIKFGYFGIPLYSTSISDAWEVVDALADIGISLHIETLARREVRIEIFRVKWDYDDITGPAPLAICRAALLATLEGEQ